MIIYFSGTGNSRYVAQNLAQEGERVVDMFDYRQEEITAKRLGIVFPVYCFCVPFYVTDFIKKLEINAEYIFAVATCGGVDGKSLNGIQYLLKQKSLNLSYAKAITMPDNCVLLNNPSTTDRLLSVEDGLIGNIKKDVDAQKTMDIKPIRPYNITTKATWFAFKKLIGIDYKKANKNCNECMVCVKKCPTENIKIDKGKIRFGDNCVNCFRCINICPTQAIGFGFVKATKEKQHIHK